eukprot:gene3580-2197_t
MSVGISFGVENCCLAVNEMFVQGDAGSTPDKTQVIANHS